MIDHDRHHHRTLGTTTTTAGDSVCSKPLAIKAASFPKSLKRGQGLKLLIHISNQQKTAVQNGVLKLVLPEGLSYKSATMFPKMKKRSSAVTHFILEASNLYWTNLSIPKGKSQRLSVEVGTYVHTYSKKMIADLTPPLTIMFFHIHIAIV